METKSLDPEVRRVLFLPHETPKSRMAFWVIFAIFIPISAGAAMLMFEWTPMVSQWSPWQGKEKSSAVFLPASHDQEMLNMDVSSTTPLGL